MTKESNSACWDSPKPSILSKKGGLGSPNLNSVEINMCWDCNFRRDFENTFLGICTWFEAHGKGPNKNIPPALVEKGCKHWQKKQK